MPTILRKGPYRVYFFSHEPGEPPHVHVDREGFTAKFWIKPILLAKNVGFAPRELRKIQLMLVTNHDKLLEAWYGYFGTSC
ncbi:MAG: DUF4160 domain-containing protein [Pseudomonadota bacterium]|jgi:hypothetical protein